MWSNTKFNISLINSWVGFYLPVFSVTWCVCVSVCACNIITSALIPLTWSTVAPGFHISCTNAIEHQRQLRKTVDALCLSHIPSEVNSLWLLPWQIAAKGREHGQLELRLNIHSHRNTAVWTPIKESHLLDSGNLFGTVERRN